MIGSRKRSQTGWPPSVPPAVEQLESREVLSAATFNVAAHIIQSGESFGNFVTGEYLRFLNRMPEQAGFNTFVGAMNVGAAPELVEAVFTSSNEYILNHGNNASSWLNSVYLDLLGRNADPGGFNHYLSQMAAGESAFQVALDIANSTERRSIVISEDYNAFLGRAPDAAGMAFWQSRMQQGLNREGLADGIVGSDEYFARHGNDNTDFVVGVYEDVLRRAPSTSELDLWLSQLPANPGPTPTPVSTTPPESGGPGPGGHPSPPFKTPF